MTERITDEQWHAICENDASYDGQFFYAVKTTKIFCKPSCKSRVPNAENVSIFQDATAALAAGYRPCKRCKSDGYHLPDEEWVLQAEAYMQENYASNLTLEALAEGCHGSPYHLHHVYKRVRGQTPLEYLQDIRLNQAKIYLEETLKSISAIGRLVGYSNAAYFSTLFKKRTHLTPKKYRENNKNEVDNGDE